MYDLFNPEQLKAELDANEDLVLVEVREAEF